METSIFVEYLKSTDPAEKRRNTSERSGMAFKIFSTSINICSDSAAPFLLHPLLCSPLRDHRASPSTCIDRVHVWCVQPRIFARGWLKCAFWKPILNWILRDPRHGSEKECIVLPNVLANRRYVCFLFFLFLDSFFLTLFLFQVPFSCMLEMAKTERKSDDKIVAFKTLAVTNLQT